MPGIQTAGSSTSSATLDASLNTIISEFKLLMDETFTVRRLATEYNLEPGTGTAKIVLNYGRVLAAALTEGVDLTQAQDLSDTQTTYTPAEVGAKVIISNLTLRRIADRDLFKRIGRILMRAFLLKQDADGCSQFANFTAASLGSNSTVMGVGHALAAVTTLRIGGSRANPEPAPEPLYGVFHPCTLNAVLGRLVPLGAGPNTDSGAGPYTGVAAGAQVTAGRGDESDELIKEGFKSLGSLFGVPIYQDANISVNSSNGANSGVFSKEGFIYVSEVEGSILPEKEDVSLRGKEVMCYGSYVWGTYRPSAYGVKMNFDATLPTA